ncbi:DMT family transporter [Oceanibium sediminis]|uniref:DMT family transporter n=1 Tax=Oceanibium sediminis TaxID=2026339 RepID=UPI0018E4DE62|nr:DMT family transporter [Oceanibium sediminis]
MPISPAAPIIPAQKPLRADNGLGLMFMAIGMLSYSGVDAMAKLLTADFHPIQIVWIRQSGLVLGVLVMLCLRGTAVLRTDHPRLQIVRGALAAGSATLFIFAVSYVPLADAVAVSFVAPFIVTALGALILREPVGRRRWIAVIIGFMGTLIVVRPGLGVIHPAVMLVMLAASMFAVRQIISRMLSGGDRTSTTVAYTALVSSAILILPLPFVWVTPSTGTQISLLAACALAAALGEICVIKAMEVAQAVVVAPVQYSMLIWGTILGYLVFGQLPDGWTLFGASIIMSTGLYTLHRERLAMRARRMGRA